MDWALTMLFTHCLSYIHNHGFHSFCFSWVKFVVCLACITGKSSFDWLKQILIICSNRPDMIWWEEIILNTFTVHVWCKFRFSNLQHYICISSKWCMCWSLAHKLFLRCHCRFWTRQKNGIFPAGNIIGSVDHVYHS